MSLPKFLQSALWSADLSKMNKQRNKKIIIKQILNFGTWRQVQWVLKNYSKKEIKEIIQNSYSSDWDQKSLNLYRIIFNIDLHKIKSRKDVLQNLR